MSITANPIDGIKTATEALKAKLGELAAINEQIASAQAVVDAVTPGNDELGKLAKQRRDEIGQAFIDKRDPQLSAFDKAITRIQKDMSTTGTAAEAAASAINLLKIRAMEIEFGELPPLHVAQDDAINVFADEKDEEGQAMLAEALASINLAFEHMAAAHMIHRDPVVPGQSPAWKHRLHQLINHSLHVTMESTAVLDKAKAELEAIGIENPGVKRAERRSVQAPTKASPDPVVTITTARPATEQEERHDARYGGAVRISQQS